MKYFLFLVLFLISGCGTIISKGHIGYEKVYINTNVNNPTITVNGKNTKYSKGHILLDKSIDNHFITVKKNGYKTQNIYGQRRVNPFVLTFDILFLVPLLVDLPTNEVYGIKPNSLNIFLTKEI